MTRTPASQQSREHPVGQGPFEEYGHKWIDLSECTIPPCDLMENAAGTACHSTTIQQGIKPFEILTFRLKKNDAAKEIQ